MELFAISFHTFTIKSPSNAKHSPKYVCPILGLFPWKLFSEEGGHHMCGDSLALQTSSHHRGPTNIPRYFEIAPDVGGKGPKSQENHRNIYCKTSGHCWAIRTVSL